MLAIAAWFENWGKDLIFLSAVVVAVGVLTKTRAVKWLWAHLVKDPLDEWTRHIIGSVLDEKVVQPNGGSSLRDAVDSLASQQETLLSWTADTEERQSDWAEFVSEQFGTVNGRIDLLCDEVGRLKQEKSRGAA